MSRSRRSFAVPPFAAALLVLALALPASASASFSLGVQASEITDSSAKLWAHSDSSGAVTAEVDQTKHFGPHKLTFNTTADPANDNTAQVDASGLKSSRYYYYRFKSGSDASEIGKFRTAPSVTSAKSIRFAISGDADAQPNPVTHEPAFNNFEVYSAMKAEKNLFNINLGDTIYSDSEVPGTPPALTVAEKWAKYRQNLGLSPLPALRSSAGIYNHWDDHEFINDFSTDEHGSTIYDNGKKAFLDYMAAGYNNGTGLYRKFRWGKNLELFFLDERSFRSAKASAGGVCDNPSGSGVVDLAPTAPQANRNVFAGINPALASPPPAACLTAINDPSRTLLGSTQLAQFKSDVANSTARFKLIINETPIQQFYAFPYDRWEGYEAERQDVIDYLKTNVKNVAFLTTDTHANMVNDVRTTTLPVPQDSGITEVVTGPVATGTFATEINNLVGGTTAASLIRNFFFKLPPPNGVGMKCANLDVYSYSEVRVSTNQVKVEPKDMNGDPVYDSPGKKCGPVVIKYKK